MCEKVVGMRRDVEMSVAAGRGMEILKAAEARSTKGEVIEAACARLRDSRSKSEMPKQAGPIAGVLQGALPALRTVP